MLKAIFCLIFLCLSNLVFAAGNVPVYTDAKPTAMITSAQPTFIIKLKANPTTGYSWFLRGYDSNLLTPVKHVFEAPKNTKKLVGAPGYELWTFHVKPAGFTVPRQTMIRFVYARPWESNNTSTTVVFTLMTSQSSKS